MKIHVNKKQVELIKHGGVVVMPSDTVYGLMCSALQPEAVSRMYEIKRRDGKPGTIIAASITQLLDMGFDEEQLQRAQAFWPDAVSVILSASDSLKYLHMGHGSLAVRIPKPEWLRELLEQTGPLATTSANFPAEPTVTTIVEAKNIFGKKVNLYVDGGKIEGVKPSKIVRIDESGAVTVLRD